MRFEIHGTLSVPGRRGVPTEAEIIYTDRCSIKVYAKCKEFEKVEMHSSLQLSGKDIITGGVLSPMHFRLEGRDNYNFGSPSSLTILSGTAMQATIGAHDSEKAALLRFFIGSMPSGWLDLQEHQMTLCDRSFRIVPFAEGFVSHRIEAPDVPSSEISKCEDAILDACFLLKGAFERDISLARIEIIQDDVVVERLLNSVKDVLLIDQGPIPEEEALRFVENGCPYLRDPKQAFPLRVLMDTMHLFQQSGYLELQALLLANFLEIVRYAYARSRPDLFTERDDQFYMISKSREHASFGFVLERLCSEFGITGWSHDFVSVRNEVIHQGEVRATADADDLDRVIKLKRFCDTVLLALLNWDKVGGRRSFYAALNGEAVPFVR